MGSQRNFRLNLVVILCTVIWMSCTKASENVVSDSTIETDTLHMQVPHGRFAKESSNEGIQDVLREMDNKMQRLEQEVSMLNKTVIELKNKEVVNNEVL